ncbi:MAG TPA: BTAD domain-containing putative transcriptional regulator [Actinophytocola sp.]|jgi:predicted ATPase/DNA-binding SARP family transcriptional activator|uniref:BTAD domain-containing putative transcriptional regulator n=1 Tax=Actinophytocola sp. TaxID=1872138 RepID=UPI002E00EA6E|nr:BTAD domain-containing putative transcriptional regulator [Actinophytocola sp.]
MLGPLEVRADDGAAVEVAGARLRTLLIVLALEPGRVVSLARIVDGIWGEEPPAGAVNAVQALVSRLRRAVPQAVVESHPAGYRLVIEPDAVDVARFERLVAAGRSDPDPAGAAGLLREALGLWRGPALLDVAEAEYFRAPLAGLAELRLAAVEARVEADLRLGRGGALTTELTSLVAGHPLRERLVGALMRALAAAGRPAAALAVYERAREALADALGADPSPELSDLHTALLRGKLAAPPAVDGRPRTNLRAGLTSFVGRDDDVAQVGKLLGEFRLTTLTGPGGSGKTRLATEVARTLVEQTPDGVWLVELAPVTDGADVPQAVLSALGLREQALGGPAPAGEPADRLVAALRGRGAVLIMDNCEHVIGAVAALADRLLGECPRLRILATSREPLAITGEALWPVEPLALPPRDADLTGAMAHAAVRLLGDRAAAARPGFAVTEATLPAVVRVCRALDGMPLAIELAAARLRTLSVEQLASRLDDRFQLLTGGARTALPRHQTLRAVVDWSWEMLSAAERVVLRRLAVFSGGASVEAAGRVCGTGRELDLLDALTDKSLLVTAGDGRYRMLETIKAYGLVKLDEAGERETVRLAHATYFAELAEQADPHLRRAGQLLWLDRLAAEHDNITSAVRGAIAAGDAGTAARLVAAAAWYWWLSGHKAEGSELAAAALAVPGPAENGALAMAYAASVLFATAGLGDERATADHLHKALVLARQAKSPHPLLRFLEPLDVLLQSSTTGTPVAPDALDVLVSDPDPWVRAQTLLSRARMRIFSGAPHAEAEADIAAGLAEFQAIGERWGIAFALSTLADLVAQRGDLTAAITHYEQAIDVVTEVGTVEDGVWMRARQAQLYWLRGDHAGSAVALAAAERDAGRAGWPDALAGLAGAKAELALWQGDPVEARAQLGRAEAAVRHIAVHPVWTARALGAHGSLDALAGDLDSARARHAEALRIAVQSGHAPTIAQMLVAVADLALRQGKPGEAARLLAAATAVRGMPDRSNPDVARVAEAARAALGEREFTEAARHGEDATAGTALELAAVTLAG